MLIEAFLSRVDEFCRRSGRREGGVSTVLFDDGHAIKRLRGGKSCTVRSLERAHARLDALFTKLDADEAFRAAVGRGGGDVVHPGTLPVGGANCDRNAAAELRDEVTP